MKIWHYKGVCRTCGAGIGWTKQKGWEHISISQCNMLIPKKGSVNK